MLTKEDEKWLQDNYPELKFEDNKISGNINFTATYNKDTGRFLVIKDSVEDGVGGLRLSGNFPITIRERTVTPYSKLPAVHVQGIDRIPNRHFNQSDSSACLGTPLEEKKFYTPALNFPRFLEELVIPFLYGQVYYTSHEAWPWFDYDHGGIGLLQSYSRTRETPTQPLIKELLLYLESDDAKWPLYKDVLLLPRPSKRPCPCGSKEKLKDCHSGIIEGINQLKADIREVGLPSEYRI